MRYSFEETQNKADEALDDMEQRLARMTKSYNAYTKQGATESAAKLKEEIDSLEKEIDCEQELYRQTFY